MTELIELTKDFKVSRPIFRLSMDFGRIEVDGYNPVYQYRPIPEEGNVLSEIVCEFYKERFNMQTGVFRFDRDEIAERALDHIRAQFTIFLSRHMPMKNPSQSKLYKWYYNNLPDYLDFNDKLIMVYKYMRTFCDKSMKSSDTPHIENTLALLAAIMEKHENK